jgi:hypothetical protein
VLATGGLSLFLETLAPENGQDQIAPSVGGRQDGRFRRKDESSGLMHVRQSGLFGGLGAPNIQSKSMSRRDIGGLRQFGY